MSEKTCIVKNIRKSLSSGADIEVRMERVGKDMHLLLTGGTDPHIGCVVMSVPRLSLSGDRTASATSSVINVIGHKDEEICRVLAEAVCRAYQCLVVCVGGFHEDHLQEDQITEIKRVVAEELIPQLTNLYTA
ncbi:MAG: hypothetical protein LIO96_10700 [Lachnospiraceae bacterium]|nr:hypothetical protein [Lachnospiraceae bacterium]